MKSNFNSVICLFALCATLWLASTPLLNAQTDSPPAQIPVDSTTIRQVDSLLQVVFTLSSNREFDRALQLLEHLQPIIAEKIGHQSVQYAAWLLRRGRISIIKGEIKDAEKGLLEAENIHIRYLKETQDEYSAVLYALGAFVYYRTNDSLCESYLMRTKAVLEKTDKRKQVIYSRVLGALGNFYSFTGQLDQAEAIMLESINAIEAMKGKENADYTLALDNLSLIYTKKNQFQKAIDILQESCAIKAKTLGVGHPDYANSVSLLGLNYTEIGAFEQAEPLYQKALSIVEAAYGQNTLQYAQNLESVAIFYITALDDAEKAEQFLLTARDITRNLPDGNTRPAYFNVTKNLASLYLEMGEFKKSESLYEEVQTFAAAVGTNNYDYVLLRINMGILYNRQQRYEAAEQVCQEVLAIEKKRTGTETQLYAQTCLVLGNSYSGQGAYAEAEKVLQESVDILARIVSKENLLYGESLTSLAEACQNLGQYDRAEQYYREVLQLQEKTIGKQHSNYLFTLQGLARLHDKRGKQSEAATYWLAYNQLARQLIEKSTSYMSEQQMLDYIKTFEAGIDAFHRFAQQHPTPQFCALTFDNSLLFNGLLLENARRISTEANRADSLTRTAYARWQNTRRYLAVQYAKPLMDRKRVAETEEEAQKLEKELTQRLTAFDGVRQAPRWQEVQKALRPNEAALEYVYYRTEFGDGVKYAALVLLPGTGAPTFVPLFEEREITALFKNKGARKSDYVNTLYANPAQTTGPQKNLYQAIWQPLETALAGAKTVYFSPTGLLHRLNFNAIMTKDGKPLGYLLNLVQLGSTRQIALPPPTTNSAPSSEAILFGGINYEPDTLNNPPIEVKSPVKPDYAGTRGGLSFEGADSTLRGGTWAYLPWTDKEVRSLQVILKQAGLRPILNRGSEASEEAFKSIGVGGASPRVLHLATHGFFFPDPQRLPEASPGEPAFKRAEHPMIRSGLILAGGNYAWKTGKPFRPNQEDGIITAYEISQMDLSNTELVVLSACETGLGDIEGNEGVYGLQRAFKIAGAKYIVMSLWQVPDAQTQELMTAFYTNWLSQKMAIPEAFRAAQKAMQEKYEHPFFWAGFILLS